MTDTEAGLITNIHNQLLFIISAIKGDNKIYIIIIIIVVVAVKLFI